MEIILIRHGETYGNKAGVFHGWIDTHLTEKGIKQAHLLKERLKNEQIDYIFSSPLKRCIETARIINIYHNLPIFKVDELKEFNFGMWEGMGYEEIKKKYPLEAKKWEEDWKNFKIPKGERGFEFYQRVSRWIDTIIKKQQKGTFLIATHGGCIRVILSHLVGKGIDGYWNFHVKTGGIVRVCVKDGFPYLTSLD